MRKFIFFVITTAIVAGGWWLFENYYAYGKRIQINEFSEVFLEGKKMTEQDAQKLGAYLLDIGFFDASSKRSVQLSNNLDTVVVKFVVDTAKVKANPVIETSFLAMQYLLRDSVFNGKPTTVILATERFKTFKGFYATSK